VSLFTTLVHPIQSIIHNISSPQLNLWEGETIVFNSIVEARSLRRRASRLLPIPVPQVKSKTRQLILTTQRLFCLKQKGLDSLSIKSELILRASEEGKETQKESRAIIKTVELKTEKEFLVLTVRFYPSDTQFLSLMWSTYYYFNSLRKPTATQLKTHLLPPVGFRILMRLLHRMDESLPKHGRKSFTSI
jgi:hypothetical protein